MTTPLQIFPNLLSISTPFKGILLDAYGVFWGGGQVGLFPGAKEAMRQLVEEGKTVGILSNSTQPAEKERNKLSLQGVHQDRHYHFLVTSGEVARQLFRYEPLPFQTPNRKYWLCGAPHPHYSSPHALFAETDYVEASHIEEADFIYVAIPHVKGEDQLDSAIFKEAVYGLKQSGLPMVCANPDHFAHEGNPPRPVVRQGSIAALYEEAGGKVLYIGKPFSSVYQEALDQFSKHSVIQIKDILMVGDTPETDIRGARQLGMPSVLVTKTGILSERIKHRGLEFFLPHFNPTDYPDFFIERLASHAL